MATAASISSKALMSPDVLTQFIERYRELPVLWQVRSEDYSNRAKRDEAWESLVQFTRQRIPDADLDFVKKKVDSIRASFRKELRRVRQTRLSSADNVYKPTLWYYDLLLFTADQENLRGNKSSVEEEVDDFMDASDSLDMKVLKNEDEEKLKEIARDFPLGGKKSPFLKKKRTSTVISTTVPTGESQQETIVEKTMAAFSQADDEYAVLGRTYAAKIRRMPVSQRDIADKLINEVLFKGLQNELTVTTYISDNDYKHRGWMSSDTPSPASTFSNSP